jgi:serralysin
MATQDGTLNGGSPETDGQPTGNPYIDALIWGAEWDLSVEPTITYYFEGASKDTQAFTASEKAAFVQILENYEAVCNVTFTEVFAEADSDITWVKIPDETDYVAYHDVPDEIFLPDPAYGIFTTSDGGWSNVDEQGSYFYNIVQHEIGHGMGLAHPHDGGEQDDATTFPGVTPSEAGFDKGDHGLNQGIWTVMSYNSGWDQAPGVNSFGSGPSYGWAGTLMAFDIAALQYLYGVNNTYKTGDDDYLLPTANTKGTFWSCIWDAGGNDTISNEGKSGAAIINLNDAPLVGPNAGGYVSRVAGIKGGFTIANGADIENGIGGDGNDYIVGNEFDNVLDGNGGIDTVSYELAANDVTVSLLILDGTT